MRIRFVAALLGAALATAAGAQAIDPAISDPATDAVAIAPGDTIALSTGQDLRMSVQVLLDGKGPYPFIVDTGAQRTVVSRELADTLMLASAGPARLHGVTGSERVSLVHIATLDMDRYRSSALRAPTLAAIHLGAAGLIGVDSLQRQRVTIDFRSGAMTVSPTGSRDSPVTGDDIIVRGKSRAGRLVITNATIDGTRVAVIIDTGSQGSLGNEALKRRLFKQRRVRPATPVQLTDVTGGKMIATQTVTDSLKIGDFTMRALPLALADAHVFRELGLDDRPAMLLGMDGLRLFDRVSIDFAKRTIRFLLPRDVTLAAR